MHKNFVEIFIRKDTAEKLSFVSVKCAAENLSLITWDSVPDLHFEYLERVEWVLAVTWLQQVCGSTVRQFCVLPEFLCPQHRYFLCACQSKTSTLIDFLWARGAVTAEWFYRSLILRTEGQGVWAASCHSWDVGRVHPESKAAAGCVSSAVLHNHWTAEMIRINILQPFLRTLCSSTTALEFMYWFHHPPETAALWLYFIF